MQHLDFSNSRPQLLRQMMDLDETDQAPWAPEELAAIFRHQLSAPVEFDFSYLGAEASRQVQTFSRAEGPSIKTFSGLLHHPHPPIELLELTRRFAKDCRRRADAPLPDEIATVLYFLSIVAAMTKCRRRISKLDDESLRYALDWALGQPWLDDATRELFREGYQMIETAGSESDA